MGVEGRVGFPSGGLGSASAMTSTVRLSLNERLCSRLSTKPPDVFTSPRTGQLDRRVNGQSKIVYCEYHAQRVYSLCRVQTRHTQAGGDGDEQLRLSDPRSSGPSARSIRWSEDRKTEVPVEKITDEQAGNVLGAIAAATIPDPLKKKSRTIRLPNKSAPAVTSAAEADLISDLVHKIENLKESDAKARLFELEEAYEKTYFEIGGVLSVMQRGKWFDPFAIFAQPHVNRVSQEVISSPGQIISDTRLDPMDARQHKRRAKAG